MDTDNASTEFKNNRELCDVYIPIRGHTSNDTTISGDR